MELKQLAEQFPDTEEDKPLVTKSTPPAPRGRAQAIRVMPVHTEVWALNFPVRGAAVSEVWLDEVAVDPQPE